MFNKRKKYFKKKETNEFEIEKPNTKAKKTLLFFEIILVGLVLSGTIWGTVRFTNFSLVDFFQGSLYRVVPIAPESNLSEIKQSKAEILIESLPEEVFELKEVKEETSNELKLLSADGTTVIFSLNKDVEFQLTTLQNLLTKAKINKKKVKSIDLRYEKAVVVYGR